MRKPDGPLPQLLLDGLDQLDERERVGVEVVGEARLEGDRVSSISRISASRSRMIRKHLVGSEPAAARRGSQPAWRRPPPSCDAATTPRSTHSAATTGCAFTIAAGGRCAVRDHAHAVDAEQHRAAGGVGVELRRPSSSSGATTSPPRAPPASLEHREDQPRDRRAARPRCVLSATLPVNPSVTTTSAPVAGQVAALDVADEARHVSSRRS